MKESEDTFTRYPIFRDPKDLFENFRPEFGALGREHFFLIAVDSKNGAIGYHTISMGSLSASVVHSREAFKPAVPESAVAAIFLRNHHSGDPAPSSEDQECSGG